MNTVLEDLLLQEQTLQFTHFNNEDAWALGCTLKDTLESQGKNAAIEIYAFGQVIFQYAMNTTTPDNLEWIRRKRNAVLRFGNSSYYLGQYHASKNLDFLDQSHLDAKEYAAHGGAFPIRIKGSGVIGTIAISGLPQKEDHQIIIDATKVYLAQNNAD